VGQRDCDLTQQFHHVFFFGDLNYRIDLSVAPPGGHIEPSVRDMVLPAPPTVEGANGRKKINKKAEKESQRAYKRAAHAVRFTASYVDPSMAS
jgi:hypothetical protein